MQRIVEGEVKGSQEMVLGAPTSPVPIPSFQGPLLYVLAWAYEPSSKEILADCRQLRITQPPKAGADRVKQLVAISLTMTRGRLG